MQSFFRALVLTLTIGGILIWGIPAGVWLARQFAPPPPAIEARKSERLSPGELGFK